MNLLELFRKIRPYVYPYRWLVIITLILTLIGSLMAQVNAIVLDRTVDAINALINPEIRTACIKKAASTKILQMPLPVVSN